MVDLPVVKRFNVMFSKRLFQLFNGFDVIKGPNETNVVNSNFTQGNELETWNNVDYIVVPQQWDPRPAMTQFTRIIFLTDLPVKDELLGEKQNYIRGRQVASQNGSQQSQILDYIISNRINDHQNINYFPRFIKWNNLINAGELRRMTVRAMLERRDGNLVQYKLAENENFFMKLVFRRKQV